MRRPTLQAAALAALLTCAGCLSAAPTTPTPADAEDTAHFVVNNHETTAYDVAVYVVAERNASRDDFPLTVTYENGTTATYDDTPGPGVLPGGALMDAAHVEPAGGVLAAVEHDLPGKSTLHVVVTGVPSTAKTLVVASRNGDVGGMSRSSTVCTGTDADVVTYRPEHSGSRSCGDVSDVAFQNATERVVVAVDESGEGA